MKILLSSEYAWVAGRLYVSTGLSRSLTTMASLEEAAASKPITIRLPRNIYLEILRIVEIERERRPRTNRSDVILMLISLGLDKYFQQRDDEL